jgi:hypothetical protein
MEVEVEDGGDLLPVGSSQGNDQGRARLIGVSCGSTDVITLPPAEQLPPQTGPRPPR